MVPMRRRNKPKEPKEEKKDVHANISVHVPTQRYTCVCVYFHSKCEVRLILVNIGQYKCRLHLKSSAVLLICRDKWGAPIA